MEQASAIRVCSSCDLDASQTAFYASPREKECRNCKRSRSRRNRREQARRLVIAERLIDVLASLADRSIDEKAS